MNNKKWKLEDIFFKYFFNSFLISAFLSSLISIIFLSIFTNNYYDKRALKNIINLEKQNSKININAANDMVTAFITKIQIGLNELILFYKRIANDLLEDEYSHEFLTDFFISAVDVDEYFCNYNLDDSVKDVKLEVIALSNIIQNLEALLEMTSDYAFPYYFYFEKTELYMSYPLTYECNNFYEDTNFITDYYEVYKDTTCMDKFGENYEVYKMKCESYFINMLKSRTDAFDNNYLLNQNKTIFINNFYVDREFTMCIEFIDPITSGKGYACVDVLYDELVTSLESLNQNIKGYFFISNVGYNNVFFFPLSIGSSKIPTQYIFDWNFNFFLNEKVNFYYNIKKYFTSNYINYIGKNIFDEIFINGKNSSEQYFIVDGISFNYSVYPIVFENLNGQREHTFSIIYVYNNDILLEGLERNIVSMIIKILLELVFIIVFCSFLLYLVYLSFNTLCKYIVIPIKNVNYMLKRINIGGENREKYLDFLKRKQDENLEKLEQIYFSENKQNNQDIKEADLNLINDKVNEDKNNVINNIDLNDSNIENTNLYNDFNEKYKELGHHIEKENSFYDFNEQLLQYRPLEIERLVQSLLNLKEAMILTSEDGEINQIINYSYREEIFRNFKNKTGAIICQSNIGNLQGQLLKYDKAIYHLALSLQDTKLKRFLNKNISDELDESDFLLNKISNYFCKEKKKEKTNILVEKQKNAIKDDFSQKEIGILINQRYSKLIYFYYKFFKNLQKLQNDDRIKNQFMNTLFHTINYYHKILIQFIFLSFVKNDLVKIGESILDYIEFLIKFKFKTSSNNNNFLKIYYKDHPKYKEKQNIKKKIFNKILSWFNAFDDYIFYVKDNSTLNDDKNILDDYSKSLNAENNEFDLENQSTLIFKINIQKSEFLKGKFCLYCKNYKDALFYFIRASKKKGIVIDGLIKKRSLKHIYKLLLIMNNKFSEFNLKNILLEKEIKEYNNSKNKIYDIKFKIGREINRNSKSNNINIITFGKEIENIQKDILENIQDCESKKEKDVLILIDFNVYNKNEDNLNIKTYKIDTYIEQTNLILNNYLSAYDRFSVFIYTIEYNIICPLMFVNNIDINSFSKDLINCKNRIFNENDKIDEYDINLNDEKEKEIEFNLGENNLNEDSQEEFLEISEDESNYNKIKGLFKAINYLNKYSKIKESVKNDKYIILFTDFLNNNFNEAEKFLKEIENLEEDKDTIFLLVGENEKTNLKIEKNNNNKINKKLEKLILNKFGEKSELIYFENMKRIKTILSNNTVIKDEIIYPNEIYN